MIYALHYISIYTRQLYNDSTTCDWLGYNPTNFSPSNAYFFLNNDCTVSNNHNNQSLYSCFYS